MLHMCSGIAYGAAAGDSGSVLDFGGTSDVLFVGDGGVVTLRRVRAAGFALPSGRGSPVVDSIVWPSVQLAPGGTVRAPISQWRLTSRPMCALRRCASHCVQAPLPATNCFEVLLCENLVLAHPVPVRKSKQVMCRPHISWMRYVLQVSLDSVELRYQRRAEFADCAAHQASLRAVYAQRYSAGTVDLLPSGALMLAAGDTVSATIELQSYGRGIGCATALILPPRWHVCMLGAWSLHGAHEVWPTRQMAETGMHSGPEPGLQKAITLSCRPAAERLHDPWTVQAGDADSAQQQHFRVRRGAGLL